MPLGSAIKESMVTLMRTVSAVMRGKIQSVVNWQVNEKCRSRDSEYRLPFLGNCLLTLFYLLPLKRFNKEYHIAKHDWV